MICKEQKVGVKEPFHTAFEAFFLGQTVTRKEYKVVFEKALQKPFEAAWCCRENSKQDASQAG